ncbi:MAG: aconitase/3-isopropylmalate dehydratase large subunit family protein, partial [Candidatus Micrarchaeia archaeon]
MEAKKVSMSITEKILAKASGKERVFPRDYEWVNADILMTHDPCTPGTIGVFKKEFGENAKVWNTEGHVMVPDHFVYTTDANANRNLEIMRSFARKQKIKHFYDVFGPKYCGVCHSTLAEQGHVLPGTVIFGTDSHTVMAGAFGAFATGIGNTDAAFVLGTGKLLIKIPFSNKYEFSGQMPSYLMAKDLILHVLGKITTSGATYRAMEFTGETVDNLSAEERMTMCNMAIEAGAKNGIMTPNQDSLEYVKQRSNKKFQVFESDQDAQYHEKHSFNTSKLEPAVAKPNSPDNLELAKNLSNIEVSQAYIGSCTGGKITDFKAVAKVLFGKKVKIPTFAVPATKEVLRQIVECKEKDKTIYQVLTQAGVTMSFEPSCAACCGGPKDTFGRMNDEGTCISTTNRNFVGRMGNKNAEIYL